MPRIICIVYLVQFCKVLICFHAAIVHARMINNNINTVGTNDWDTEKGATGVIHSRKPATLLPLS